MNSGEALNIDLNQELVLDPDQDPTLFNKENMHQEQRLASPKTTSQDQLKEMRDKAENALRQNILQQARGHDGKRDKSEGKKLSQAEQDRLFKVRRTFQEALNKLSSNDTKEIGINEAKRIIESNADQHCLRIYLSLLCEKHKNTTTANKELQVILFGHLAKIYKADMLDPLDKPPSLLKTVVRVCESIHAFLKENSNLIHLACSNSLVEVYENCFTQKNDKLTLSLIFYEPLAAVINGGYDSMGQMAASLCLLTLFNHLISKGHSQFYDFLAPKFSQLFYKSKCDTPEMILCLEAIVEHSSLQYVSDWLTEIVGKCLRILSQPDTSTHLRKIEACNLLRLLAVRLKDTADLVIGYMHSQVMQTLDKCQKGDKVLKVRQAALKAKQQWALVKCINEEMEGKKTNEELRSLSPEQLLQERTGYGNLTDLRQQVLKESEEAIVASQKKQRPQTAKIEAQMSKMIRSSSTKRQQSPKKFKMLKELARLNGEVRTKKPYSPNKDERVKQFESNWSAATRGQSYLKRKEGVGGGNIPGYQAQNEKIKLKTDNVQRQSLRDLIADQMRSRQNLEGQISQEQLRQYGTGDIEIYDVLKRQYEEEKKNLDAEMRQDNQGMIERNIQQERVNMTGRKFQDGVSPRQEKQSQSKQDISQNEKSQRSQNEKSKQDSSVQNISRQKTQKSNQRVEEDNSEGFFEEEELGGGDQGEAPEQIGTFGVDSRPQKVKTGTGKEQKREGQHDGSRRVSFSDTQNLDNESRKGHNQERKKSQINDPQLSQNVINEILNSDKQKDSSREHQVFSNKDEVSFSQQQNPNSSEAHFGSQQLDKSPSQKVEEIVKEYEQKQLAKLSTQPIKRNSQLQKDPAALERSGEFEFDKGEWNGDQQMDNGVSQGIPPTLATEQRLNPAAQVNQQRNLHQVQTDIAKGQYPNQINPQHQNYPSFRNQQQDNHYQNPAINHQKASSQSGILPQTVYAGTSEAQQNQLGVDGQFKQFSAQNQIPNSQIQSSMQTKGYQPFSQQQTATQPGNQSYPPSYQQQESLTNQINPGQMSQNQLQNYKQMHPQQQYPTAYDQKGTYYKNIEGNLQITKSQNSQPNAVGQIPQAFEGHNKGYANNYDMQRQGRQTKEFQIKHNPGQSKPYQQTQQYPIPGQYGTTYSINVAGKDFPSGYELQEMGQIPAYQSQPNFNQRSEPLQKFDYHKELQRMGIPSNNHSSQAFWQLGIMDQLQSVGDFMDQQFKDLDRKLKTVNFKIEETKYGIMKNQFEKDNRIGSPKRDSAYLAKSKLAPQQFY